MTTAVPIHLVPFECEFIAHSAKWHSTRCLPGLPCQVSPSPLYNIGRARAQIAVGTEVLNHTMLWFCHDQLEVDSSDFRAHPICGVLFSKRKVDGSEETYCSLFDYLPCWGKCRTVRDSKRGSHMRRGSLQAGIPHSRECAKPKFWFWWDRNHGICDRDIDINGRHHVV